MRRNRRSSCGRRRRRIWVKIEEEEK